MRFTAHDLLHSTMPSNSLIRLPEGRPYSKRARCIIHARHRSYLLFELLSRSHVVLLVAGDQLHTPNVAFKASSLATRVLRGHAVAGVQQVWIRSVNQPEGNKRCGLQVFFGKRCEAGGVKQEVGILRSVTRGVKRAFRGLRREDTGRDAKKSEAELPSEVVRWGRRRLGRCGGALVDRAAHLRGLTLSSSSSISPLSSSGITRMLRARLVCS